MLIGNYKIESDSLNIVLYQKRVRKKGKKELWGIVGYYGSLKSALKAIADLEIKLTELKDFKTICKRQNSIYKLIERALNRCENVEKMCSAVEEQGSKAA